MVSASGKSQIEVKVSSDGKNMKNSSHLLHYMHTAGHLTHFRCLYTFTFTFGRIILNCIFLRWLQSSKHVMYPIQLQYI